MDAECLSSWRRAGPGINRRPPSPQGHLCSQSPLRLLYSWKCVWKPSRGANGQGNARTYMCTHTCTHIAVSEAGDNERGNTTKCTPQDCGGLHQPLRTRSSQRRPRLGQTAQRLDSQAPTGSTLPTLSLLGASVALGIAPRFS